MDLGDDSSKDSDSMRWFELGVCSFVFLYGDTMRFIMFLCSVKIMSM